MKYWHQSCFNFFNTYFDTYFVFNGITYLQKKDCAMGTKCAPSYANIFNGWFEQKFIFPLLANLSDFYLRFRDGIFLIWNGTKTELDDIF